ncbi:MAG TPA: SIS domain-containing protein [Candidatus Limnocylindrales bacterium]|nr:SIS domain-containing protein [Candidatus Limnocylindrales bacterium]
MTTEPGSGLADPTWMRREIAQAPDVVAGLLRDGRAEIAAAAAAIREANPAWAMLVARGTSDHAAIHLRYLIETELGIPCGLAAPSVTTIYGAELRWRGGLVIALSQSGRSPDLVAVVEAARAGGAITVAIANDVGSPLAAAAEHLIDCRAGHEQAVAATKSYVAQLAAGAALVGALARDGSLAAALDRLPATLHASLATTLEAITDHAPIVAEFAASERSIVVSRGYDHATALEIALKLKETSRLFAEGYSAADLSHGPIVLSGPEIPVLAIRPDGRMGPEVDTAIAAAARSGARPWVVGGGDAPAGPRTIRLPIDVPDGLAPLAFVLPGQLLAEAVARRRGYDPDAPPGLQKVTLTR